MILVGRTCVNLAADSHASLNLYFKKYMSCGNIRHTNIKIKVGTFHFMNQNIQNIYDASAMRQYIMHQFFGIISKVLKLSTLLLYFVYYRFGTL